jgi:hypothetical protein
LVVIIWQGISIGKLFEWDRRFVDGLTAFTGASHAFGCIVFLLVGLGTALKGRGKS